MGVWRVRGKTAPHQYSPGQIYFRDGGAARVTRSHHAPIRTLPQRFSRKQKYRKLQLLSDVHASRDTHASAKRRAGF